MTIVDSLISIFTRFSSWLISRQWQREEIFISAIVALFLLLLILRASRKTRCLPQYTPTIGIRLAHREAKH
jgi:hypothetical protein